MPDTSELAGSTKNVEDSPGTITVNLAALDSSVAKRIIGLLNRNQVIPRRRIKVKREIDLETSEVRGMLDLAEQTGPVHYCLLGLMSIGLREAEVTGSDDPRIPLERRLPGLRVEDLRRDSIVIHGKGYTVRDPDGSVRKDASKIILYPLPSKLLDATRCLAKDRENGNLIPVGTRTGRRVVRRYAKDAGIDEWRLVHPHRFRHWFEEAARPLCNMTASSWLT